MGNTGARYFGMKEATTTIADSVSFITSTVCRGLRRLYGHRLLIILLYRLIRQPKRKLLVTSQLLKVETSPGESLGGQKIFVEDRERLIYSINGGTREEEL
jgi:hypothetical protein